MKWLSRLLVVLTVLLPFAPSGALSQEPVHPKRVGLLMYRRRPVSLDRDGQIGAFLRGLREQGYVDGRNMTLEWRFAEGRPELLDNLAGELLGLKLDLIVTDGTPSTRAAQRATSSIPIVFANAGDPVDSGLVKDLARPGGNTTGIANLVGDSAVKQMEMLALFVPGLSRLAVAFNPENASFTAALARLRTAARARGVEVLPVEVRGERDLEAAFRSMSDGRVGAFLAIPDPVASGLRSQYAERAIRQTLPSAGMNSEWADAGFLMTYGQNVPENYRRAANYVDKVLRGARPRDLPVEQPTKLDLVINRKTARALGLTIPPDLLLLADRVIE